MGVEDQLAAYYEAEAAAEGRPEPSELRTSIRTGFVDLLVAESRTSVVEIGAGPGRDAHAFVEAGIDYIGFDLAVGNARLAHEHGVTVIPGSLFDPPLRPASFASAWTMSTLLHVPDSRFDDAMTAIMSLVSSGAPVGLGVWGGQDREFVNESDRFDPPRFYSHRSDERLQQMLGRHGDVERFDSWVTDVEGWEYQFAVVRKR